MNIDRLKKVNSCLTRSSFFIIFSTLILTKQDHRSRNKKGSCLRDILVHDHHIRGIALRVRKKFQMAVLSGKLSQEALSTADLRLCLNDSRTEKTSKA
jgi:hypothetical protein